MDPGHELSSAVMLSSRRARLTRREGESELPGRREERKLSKRLRSRIGSKRANHPKLCEAIESPDVARSGANSSKPKLAQAVEGGAKSVRGVCSNRTKPECWKLRVINGIPGHDVDRSNSDASGCRKSEAGIAGPIGEDDCGGNKKPGCDQLATGTKKSNRLDDRKEAKLSKYDASGANAAVPAWLRERDGGVEATCTKSKTERAASERAGVCTRKGAPRSTKSLTDKQPPKQLGLRSNAGKSMQAGSSADEILPVLALENEDMNMPILANLFDDKERPRCRKSTASMLESDLPCPDEAAANPAQAEFRETSEEPRCPEAKTERNVSAWAGLREERMDSKWTASSRSNGGSNRITPWASRKASGRLRARGGIGMSR